MLIDDPVEAQLGSQLFLSHLELLEILLEPLGLLDRVQVAALDVLDQRRLEDLLVVEFHDVDWHFRESGGLGSAEPPFAGDELIAVLGRPNDQWLQHAVGLDALRERLRLIVVEPLSRLIRVELNLDRPQFAPTGPPSAASAIPRIPQERVQPPAETRFRGFHARSPL